MSTVNAPSPRSGHTAVWTGTSMIVWGGDSSNNSTPALTATGGKYFPATDTWLPTSTSGAPPARRYHGAVWTGKEMLVFMGFFGGGPSVSGRYVPSTDSWLPMSMVGAPTPLTQDPRLAWTGAEVVVWGPNQGSPPSGLGGVYDPALDTWRATTPTGAPLSRTDHMSVW